MSIASEITRINNNIASAYTACYDEGATMPQIQNSANLASTIRSIPSGGTPTTANCKVITLSIINDITTATLVTLVEEDPIIAQHYNDDNLFIIFRADEGMTTAQSSVKALMNGNILYVNTSGAVIRSSNSTVSATKISNTLKEGYDSSQMYGVDSSGNLKYMMSTTFPIRHGNYTITILW